MKDLYILRHGKSGWDIDDIADIDRSLKERGINDAYRMAERLKSQSRFPDIIFSSPAVRALHSATIFARTLNFSCDDIKLKKEIYHATAKSLMNIIKQVDSRYNSLMIFGHNPTFTDFANYFIGNKIDNMPTSGMVGLRFNIEKWQDLSADNLKDWFFDFPKNNTKLNYFEAT